MNGKAAARRPRTAITSPGIRKGALRRMADLTSLLNTWTFAQSWLATPSFLELQRWRTGGRVQSRAVRSTEKQPSANAERRVENHKKQQKMRKNPRDGQGYEHQGNEHHSVQYASGDDPPAAGE